ncbi:MAG: helix-turn-helix transcriptional regulator [Lachnospiraceae bacterium]|nr:helix-turn-helix transcriptional regulator [Lachnospiraceae bacterium]
MKINETVKRIIKEDGRTQTWVAKEMNKVNPSVMMTNVKLSAIVTGKRTMTGDEMIAFCKATKRNPDVFMDRAM